MLDKFFSENGYTEKFGGVTSDSLGAESGEFYGDLGDDYLSAPYSFGDKDQILVGGSGNFYTVRNSSLAQ